MNIRPRIRRDPPVRAESPAATERPQWGLFAVICLAYFVTTTGEQMLGPLFPTTSDDLGLSVAQGGIAFGTLTGSIAVANLIGGSLLTRRAPSSLIRAAGVVGVVGSVLGVRPSRVRKRSVWSITPVTFAAWGPDAATRIWAPVWSEPTALVE
jgi:hypothetical protein